MNGFTLTILLILALTNGCSEKKSTDAQDNQTPKTESEAVEQKEVITEVVTEVEEKTVDPEPVESATPAEKTSQTEVEVVDIIMDNAFNGVDLGAPFKVDSFNITGDILTLVVNYSGGCKDHVFTLYGNNKYKKSMPPQLQLYLHHQNNGDACRKMEYRHLKFDISAVQYPASDKLILTLNKLPKKAEYKYVKK